MRRICLVGAGYISRVHKDVLRDVKSAHLACVVDPNLRAARALAGGDGGVQVFASAAEALAADAFDAAHVLVPPSLHCATGVELLRAGKPVLLEKPLATATGECEALLAASREGGASLGVNQNFLWHPAFLRLRRLVESGRIGRPRSLECTYNAPLRQLAARQFGHWMFDAPGNILLEQAVHPLSQIVALAGDIEEVRALASAPVELAPGIRFYPALDATLHCARLPASLRLAFGQSFPFWRITVVCDDGVGVADILANRCYSYRRTRWLDAVDGALSSLRTGAEVAGAGLGNAVNFALSALRLKGRTDPFLSSMAASVAAFHRALDEGAQPEADGALGAHLVATCEKLAVAAYGAPVARPARRRPPPPEAWDVALLGGTGFIGTPTVRHFLARGMHVAVLARSLRNLPAVFDDPAVALVQGDIRDRDAVGRAIGEARYVVNLAHGGGGGSFEQVRDAMVGGAEMVARLCIERGVGRLVHIGSIAALYLGPQGEAITGTTPPDPEADQRADYARAKALADLMLLDLHRREGLPVVVLRPGLVVGAGTPPLHSGIGFFNNDQHCIGWNGGRNPLPFVLVDDVAAAIVEAALRPGIDGRAYNLVGDVRLTAREYVAALGRATGRPLRFHSQSPSLLWAAEAGKWLVKRAGGRAVPLPSRRDIVSRGLMARFDCSDAVRDLGWSPVADREVFVRQAIDVHAS